jgi:hypothetical protein
MFIAPVGARQHTVFFLKQYFFTVLAMFHRAALSRYCANVLLSMHLSLQASALVIGHPAVKQFQLLLVEANIAPLWNLY